MPLLIAFALAFAPPPAAATPVLTLKPGQAATVRFDDGGVAQVERRTEAAPLSDFDRESAMRLTEGEHPEALGPNAVVTTDKDGLPAPPPLPKASVEISFVALPGKPHMLLMVYNGYDRAFRYKAVLHRADRTKPTDVCAVLPKLRGHEVWPYAIDAIELSDLKLEPWPAGRPIVCE